MKEVAQTVGKHDSADDFMGFIAVPLNNIKLDGMERWLGLRSTSALQVYQAIHYRGEPFSLNPNRGCKLATVDQQH